MVLGVIVDRSKSSLVRVFITKSFSRFATDFGVTDPSLWTTVHSPWDADLGGGLFNYRLAREGEGLSGGARVMVALRLGERAVLMSGFEKKDKANITRSELKELRMTAKAYLALTKDELKFALKTKTLREILKPSKGANNAGENL